MTGDNNGNGVSVEKYDNSGALLWAKQATSGTGNAIAVDASGNSYVAGGFGGTVIFGSGETNQTTLVSVGANEIFLAKYDGNGALVWAKQAVGSNNSAWGIAVDGFGNSYVTGQFSTSTVFGAGEVNETTLVSAGIYDIFVAKYDSNGLLLWAKRAGGTNDLEEGLGVALDGSGNIYVAGIFTGTAIFGAGEVNQITLVGGSTRGFVAKYASNGSIISAKQVDSGGGNSNPFDLAVDGSGNTYVTGYISGTVIFGAGETNQTTLTTVGSFDIFVAKFSADSTPPTITITSPVTNATYQLNASVAASYTCADSGSGVASCQGTVANGSLIDTSSTGTKTFTVTSTDNAGNTGSSTVTYSVVLGGGGGSSSADLGITLSAPSKVSAGGSLTYSITVSNAGKVTATGIVVSDALPAGTVFASATASQGLVAAPPVGSNGTVTVSLGSLVNGAKATINIVTTVTAATGAVLTDTATVTATTQDLNSKNNSATQKTTVK